MASARLMQKNLTLSQPVGLEDNLLLGYPVEDDKIGWQFADWVRDQVLSTEYCV